MTITATGRTALYNHIADLIRSQQLDGQDIHDITVSVDAGELDYTGAGRNVHAMLLAATTELDCSAADLTDHITRTVMGW